jgi:uncharacterized membrane protein (DUF4010 family)
MIDSNYIALGIALGLGLLVGLQRERYHSRIAGIRTFTLITLFGSVSGMIAQHFNQSWIIAIGGLSIALLLGIANFLKRKEKDPDIGQTTEIAALLMYAVGACLILKSHLIGVVVGAMVALLLYMKQYLSKVVTRLGEKDLRAIMLFVAITLIVLPILPDKNFGPYQVFNLREIWWMVILIVGISITGYFTYKWLGKNIGTGLSGILGGLISSTATTVTYSRQSKKTPATTRLAGFVIVTASTVAFVRVILEVSVVAPRQLKVVAPPLLLVTIFMALLAVILFYYNKNDTQQTPEPDNPAQFKTAIIFAFLYAVILLAIAFVKDKFGQVGLYFVAIISGLTDMDAITLSLSNMMNDERIEAATGWNLILLAALSNLVFKGAIAVFIGNRKLAKIIIPTFGLTLLAGGLVWWFWK